MAGCGVLAAAQQSWTAPMNGPKGGNAAQYLADHWHVPNAHFYGHQDVSFTNDPISGDNNTSVLQVKYKAGAYGAMGVGGTSGCEFNACPFGHSASFDSAMVSYQVAFAEGFDWVEGGKLPGIFGGMCCSCRMHMHTHTWMLIVIMVKVMRLLAVLVVIRQTARIASLCDSCGVKMVWPFLCFVPLKKDQ